MKVPDNLKVPVLAAQAALLERDSASAITILEKARQSGNLTVAVLDNLVVAYALEAERTGAEENREEALRLSKEILNANPSDPVAHFNRAMILQWQDKRKEAARAFEQARQWETDPKWRALIENKLESLR